MDTDSEADNQLVRINTLRAGQLIQTTKGRIYVLVQMIDTHEGLRVEVAECGRKKIDTVRDLIDANAMVTPVEADFFIGSDCVHRTYKEEDSDEMVVMPSDPRTGSKHSIRRCIQCKRTIPNATVGFTSRCKGCARSYRKQHRQRNRARPLK